MKGVAFWFFGTAALSVAVGMGWGIMMSATQDHSLSPAHGHLNLIGWVTMGLFGVYYHLVPTAAEKFLAKIHFVLAFAGLVIIVPGIVQALNQSSETLAKLGSVLTMLSMVTFLFTVARDGLNRQT
jgi:cbb3-type cytochrome oxidase subunit 1